MAVEAGDWGMDGLVTESEIEMEIWNMCHNVFEGATAH